MSWNESRNLPEPKCVIVTGATGGIGKATVKTLADAGYNVASVDINEESSPEFNGFSSEKGNRVKFFKADVSNEKEVESVTMDIADEFGTVYGLVNNAGISSSQFGKPVKTKDLVDTLLLDIFKVNVFGAFYFTKHALKYMLIKKSGSIVNISSIYAVLGSPDSSIYAASKGALLSMTLSDSLHYAEDNIRVNAILPGFIRTPMLEKLSVQKEVHSGLYDEAISAIPMKRIGTPNDVASLIKFLISEESSYITGARIIIDGGYTLK